MKRMIITLVTVILMISCFATAASAATVSDVVAKLRDSNVKEVYVLAAESYLNTLTLTSAQCDEIITRINNTNAITGTREELSELTTAEKQAILVEFAAAGTALGLTVTVVDGDVTVIDGEDRTVFYADGPDVVKQTGFDYSIVLYGLAALVLAAAITVALRKTRAAARH
ncbi:MAG: hypothetical protein ACYCYM_11205 [Saccharofermentanales bacterium]